jgi:pyruvate dehydrogenase E1 component alpha subunit
MAIKPMIAEMSGRATGIGQGRGGDARGRSGVGILGGNGIVGAGIPLAIGASYSAVLDGSDRVSVAFFGEGASNQGAFHESLNIAAAWNLPVIFVCENNPVRGDDAMERDHEADRHRAPCGRLWHSGRDRRWQ